MDEYCEDDFQPDPCEQCPSYFDGDECKYQHDCCEHRNKFAKYSDPKNIDGLYEVFDFIKEDLKDTMYAKILDWHEYGNIIQDTIDNIALDVGVMLEQLCTVVLEYFKHLYEDKNGLQTTDYIEIYKLVDKKAIPELEKRISKLYHQDTKYDDFEQNKNRRWAFVEFLDKLDSLRKHVYLKEVKSADSSQQ